MDEQADNRKWRLEGAAHRKDTSQQWDLITAAVEEANIRYHKLEGKEATKMRGRSKVTFKNCERNLLKGCDRGEQR